MAVRLVEAVRHSDKGFAALLDGGLSPLFTALLAVFAMANDGLLSVLSCVRYANALCDLSGLTPLFAVQGVMAALTVFCLFLATRLLVEDRRVVWLALVIVLASKIFSNYASQVLTESTAFFLYFLSVWLILRILVGDRPGWRDYAATGAVLGLLALARPSYQYLIPFVGLVIFLWRIFGRGGRAAPAASATALMMAVAALALAPWLVHNYLQIGQVTISTFGPRVLVERLAYNLMTWKEWGVSFIYWLPDFGDDLARSLFAEDLWKRLTWYEPTAFYMMGRGDFMRDIYGEARAQGADGALGYLLWEYIWGDFFKHVMVTLSLALRGQWVGNYVSLAGFLLLPFCIRILHGQGRAAVFLVYCMLPYFMLGFYAFVSVNVVRYNEPLIAVFAFSLALVIVHLADKSLGCFRQARNRS